MICFNQFILPAQTSMLCHPAHIFFSITAFLRQKIATHSKVKTQSQHQLSRLAEHAHLSVGLISPVSEFDCFKLLVFTGEILHFLTLNTPACCEMSFVGRPKILGLSKEELEQQRADREMAQEKAKREKAEKRKMKNKGYGQSQERKPYNRTESKIKGKPLSSRHEKSKFSARFPVEVPSTTAAGLVLNNEQPHDMECGE
jgi:hypothetical protein